MNLRVDQCLLPSAASYKRSAELRRRLTGAVALAAGLAWSCSNLVDMPLPDGAVPMTMPPQYTLWWKLTERCALRSSDLRRVSWYVVPGADNLGQGEFQGMYFPVNRRIVLAGRHVGDAPLVRHEMLHAILGTSGHPAEDFRRHCGGVVTCEMACLSEGGALTQSDRSGPIVRPSDLEVSARVDSTRPSLARDSGWAALTIAIRNPRSTAVRIRLTPLQPGYFAAATYGYRRGYCDSPTFGGPSYSYLEDSTTVLAAGETQRKVYDFHVRDVCTVLKPFFNDDTLPNIRIEPQP
jgi:hypothetical protein